MIDLQEKMEFEEKQNKEKNETSSLYSESRDNVFNTDAIDSILNGTNNEGIEILFDVNKNNLKQDEDIFNKEMDDGEEVFDPYDMSSYTNPKSQQNQDLNNDPEKFIISFLIDIFGCNKKGNNF